MPLETPTLPPATRTNTYVAGVHRACVVDPAPSGDEPRAELLAYLRALQSRGVELSALVLTHHHRDHVGATAFLARELHLPVWAHAETASRVDFHVDHLLDDGQPLPCDGPSWTSVFTPGHAPGHLCFHRPEGGFLVAGDMLTGVGSVLVDPDEGSMRLYLQSLRRLEALDPAVVLPAHGPSMVPGVVHVRHHLAHRTARSSAVLARVVAGDRTPADMVPHIYAGTPPAMFPFAERSVMTMLIQHREEGRVVERDGQWLPA